jgi:hydrogenase 3 maturation protease
MPECGPDFPDILRRRFSTACRIAIVGIGDELSPSDRLGMVVAREIEEMHLPCIKVFFAGTVPESITGLIRKWQPDHVLFIDSADMGVPPGSIKVLAPEKTDANLLASHVLPLSVVMDFIGQDTGAGVMLLGIQPDLTRINSGMYPSGQELFTHNIRVLFQTLRDICCNRNVDGNAHEIISDYSSPHT